MSLDDHIMDVEEIARTALFKAKALEYCEFHDITIRVHDDDCERHAYALATNVLKKDGSIAYMREDVMDAIKYELDQAADNDCPECGSVD